MAYPVPSWIEKLLMAPDLSQWNLPIVHTVCCWLIVPWSTTLHPKSKTVPKICIRTDMNSVEDNVHVPSWPVVSNTMLIPVTPRVSVSQILELVTRPRERGIARTVKNFIMSGVCSSCRMGETWTITYIHGLFLLHLCNRASQYSAISNNRKSRLQKPFEPISCCPELFCRNIGQSSWL